MRKCIICTHSEREKIDRAIANKQLYETIAHIFGVGVGAIKSHKRKHIAAAVARAESVAAVRCAVAQALPDIETASLFWSSMLILRYVVEGLFQDFLKATTIRDRARIAYPLLKGLHQLAKREGAYRHK